MVAGTVPSGSICAAPMPSYLVRDAASVLNTICTMTALQPLCYHQAVMPCVVVCGFAKHEKLLLLSQVVDSQWQLVCSHPAIPQMPVAICPKQAVNTHPVMLPQQQS